jgi:hypothetical protein
MARARGRQVLVTQDGPRLQSKAGESYAVFISRRAGVPGAIIALAIVRSGNRPVASGGRVLLAFGRCALRGRFGGSVQGESHGNR